MMLKRSFRLTGKDINFLVKKRQYVSAGFFSFFYFKQFSNLSYHQISANIPLKFSKKAVMRHLIKRAIVDSIQDTHLMDIKIKGSYYKIFIMINKSRIPVFQKEIEKHNKKAIISFVQKEFMISWESFVKKIR